MTQIQEENVPKLRFPEFEGGWEKLKFGDLYSFTSTNSLSRDKLNYEIGDIHNIHYGDIHTRFSAQFSFENETVPKIIPEELLIKDIEKKFVDVGDLIIADASEDYADIGKAIEILSTAGRKIVAGLHTIHATPSSNLIAVAFAGHWTKSMEYRRQVMHEAQGAKVLGISARKVAEFIFSAPTLPEQRKIAGFLGTVDEKIAQLSRKKALLENYKTGCMQQLFSRKVRFKDDGGKCFPDWEEKRVSDVFQVTRGQVLAVPKMTQTPEGASSFPVYSSQTKNKGLTGYYTDSLFQDAITWTTDGANAGNVQFRPGKFYCTNVCGVLLSEQGYANTCVAEMLNRVTERYVSYVGNPKLMNNVMGSIRIQLPHPAEQRKIANFLSALDRKIDLANQELTFARSFKVGLLQQMFV